MRSASIAFLCICLAASIPAVAYQKVNGTSLKEVLKQLEATGETFRTFSAKFVQKKYTRILEEFDAPESGLLLYARAKDGSALLRQEVVQPAPRILTIKGGIATIYQPRLKQGQVVNLGKNKDKAEYLVLGLGQSPGKLQESFDLAYRGSEKVGDVSCSILELTPKNPAAAAFFSSITLWIRKSNGVPIQQKLLEPSGDYLLVNFSGEKLNSNIPMSSFEQSPPKDAEMQKIGQ